jgi:hypothetical protein
MSARRPAILTFFVVFPVPPGKFRNSILKFYHNRFFKILTNSSFTYHPFIWQYIVLVSEKASLNELQVSKPHTILFFSFVMCSSSRLSYSGWIFSASVAFVFLFLFRSDLWRINCVTLDQGFLTFFVP